VAARPASSGLELDTQEPPAATYQHEMNVVSHRLNGASTRGSMGNWQRVQLVPSSPTETAMQAAEVAVRLLRAHETDDVGERTVKPSPQQRVQPPGAPTSVKKGQPQHGIRRKLVAMGGNNHQPRKN
jgi:hypothetical protein